MSHTDHHRSLKIDFKTFGKRAWHGLVNVMLIAPQLRLLHTFTKTVSEPTSTPHKIWWSWHPNLDGGLWSSNLCFPSYFIHLFRAILISFGDEGPFNLPPIIRHGNGKSTSFRYVQLCSSDFTIFPWKPLFVGTFRLLLLCSITGRYSSPGAGHG